VRGGRRQLLGSLVLLVFIFGAPVIARAESTPSPARAVQMLNEWRALVGVAPVVENPAETEGCRAHADYYRLTHGMGHDEQEGPGYTAAGYAAAASSVLAYEGAADGPYTWEGAVYHRGDLLNPRLATTGFWAEFELGCMGVFGIDRNRTTPTLTSYTYPYQGQEGVETEFSCLEIPNPCDNVPGYDGHDPVGFISSIQFNGPWPLVATPQVTAAQLVPDGGAPVPITVIDGITSGFGVIPTQPLAEGTWYTGTASGTIDAVTTSFGDVLEPFSVSWRFRTKIVAHDPAFQLSIVGGRAHVSSADPGPVEVSVQDGSSRRYELNLRPAGGGRYQATAPGPPLRTPRWKTCAAQPADAEGWWKAAKDCLRGGLTHIDVDVLYASRYLVRLRFKAPAGAQGRIATVTMWPHGGPPAHARIRLQAKSRLDLPGIPKAGARLRVEVNPFRWHSIPQRVVPVVEPIHWAAAPPSG
jgi:hypothetical protein